MPLRSDIQIINGRIVQTRQTTSRGQPARGRSAATFDSKLRAQLAAAVRGRRLTPAQANALYARETKKHRLALQKQAAALQRPPTRTVPPAAIQALGKVPVIGSVVGLGEGIASMLGLDQVPTVDVSNPESIRHYHDNLAFIGDQGALSKYEQAVDQARIQQGLEPFYGSTTALPRAADAPSLGLRSVFAPRTQME